MGFGLEREGHHEARINPLAIEDDEGREKGGGERAIEKTTKTIR